MGNLLTRVLMLIGVALAAAFIWWWRPAPGEAFGIWSLLPAIITIVVCFASRNVLLALLLGVISGSLIAGELNVIRAFLVPALGSENFAQILLVYLWALGGLLGLWNRNGGARLFAETMAQKFVRSRVSAKLFAWCMGVVFHQGGTISTVLAGTTVRPVSDQHGVAHEELAYVVDSTASPIATLIPFNVWPIYVAGLITIEPLAGLIDSEADAIALFYQAIPLNFYALIAVFMTLLFSLDKLPWLGGPMRGAVERVRATGALNSAHAQPMMSSELTESAVYEHYRASVIDFLVPITTLLGMCVVPWLLGGAPLVFEGFGMAVVAAMITSIARGMPVAVVFEAVITGVKGVTIGALVLGLAVTLAGVSEALGTAEFVIQTSQGSLSAVPFVLPALLLLVSMIVAFSIGSSWGTYAVMFPIALPLAMVLSPDPMFVVMCFGALLGGAVFGDQCSPISDTTILAALACGADLMDHVRTQLPLALTAAALAAVLYTLIALLRF